MASAKDPRCRRLLGDVTGYEELNQTMLEEAWSSFSSQCDFNLARWFVQCQVAKTRIDDYFGKNLGSIERGSFRCTYSLEKQLETLDPFREYLSWTEAKLESGNRQPHSTTTILYPVFATSSGRSLTENIWFTHRYANMIQMVINYTPKCTQQTGGGKLWYDKSAITYLHSTKIL